MRDTLTRRTAEIGVDVTQIYLPENLDDPYPFLAQVRQANPVLWDPGMGHSGAWIITGYDAATTALRTPTVSAVRPHWTENELPAEHRQRLAPVMRMMSSQLFALDAPVHQQIRGVLAKRFLPQAVKAMRERIAAIADELLDAVVPQGHMEAVRDYTYALPAIVMADLIGLPREDRGQIFKWIIPYGILLDDGPMLRDDAVCIGGLEAVAEFVEYVRQQLVRCRRERHPGLLLDLAEALDRGEFRDDEDLAGNVVFVITAGQITTAHQLGNSIVALLTQGDGYRQVRDDPELASSAVDELARFDCSVQLARRYTTAALELEGQAIGPNEELFIWLAAANRDPRRYAEPDTLDLHRPDVKHVAFGHGAHYCLGAHLGRLEHEIGIARFVQRVSAPRVDLATASRTALATFRGVHHLPLSFGDERAGQTAPPSSRRPGHG